MAFNWLLKSVNHVKYEGQARSQHLLFAQFSSWAFKLLCHLRTWNKSSVVFNLVWSEWIDLRLFDCLPLGPFPNVGADENVHFYQLHHESEVRLPTDCFLTSFLKYDVIQYVLTKSPWLYCYWHICYFNGRCQIAKSNRWTCISLLCVTINKALPVTTQSFASFVLQNKIYKGRKMWSKNQKSFRWGRLNWSLLLKKLLLPNKGQITAKTMG